MKAARDTTIGSVLIQLFPAKEVSLLRYLSVEATLLLRFEGYAILARIGALSVVFLGENVVRFRGAA